jgi:hypothetical protein
MQKSVLIAPVLVIALGVSNADARRHGHSRYRHWDYALREALPQLQLPRRVGRLARAYARVPPAAFPPPTWQLQPPEPNWEGRRYMSPGGEAWLAFYTSPADKDGRAEHLKSVAFADGEVIFALQGDQNELTVTGSTGERMFYRKVRLACRGGQWHHVALEFPLGDRQQYELLVAQAVQVLDQADASGCTDPSAAEPEESLRR